jgi:hypothetical protein
MQAAPHQFRVTKYNPARRDLSGAYPVDEWTSRADIGRSFAGRVLSEQEYFRVETAYTNAAVAFLQEANISALTVKGLEDRYGRLIDIAEGDSISVVALPKVIASLLRESYWCRLEGLGAFVHVGYDYYMYIGVPTSCPRAVAVAQESGLFVEPVSSPYAEDAA